MNVAMDAEELKRMREREWRGYSLDELRYRRAMALVNIQNEKNRTADGVARLRNGDMLLSMLGLRRLSGIVDYARYVAVAVRLWRRVARMWRIIRKK